MQTGEVAVSASRKFKIVPELTERDVNAIVRAWPQGQRPPLVRGRRRWRPCDVERLYSAIRERNLLSPPHAGGEE